MAVLGKTAIGGTEFATISNEYDSTKHVLPFDAVVVEMWAYCRNADAVPLGIKLAIYSDSAGLPNVFKVATDELTIAASAPAAWRKFTVSSTVTLTAGTYHLGHMGYTGTPTGGIKILADSPGGTQGAFDTQVGYPNFDSPSAGASTDTVAYSIYAIVSEVGTPPPHRTFPLLMQRFRPGRNPLPFAFPTQDWTLAAAGSAIRDLGSPSINGTSTVTATVVRDRALTGTVNGVSTVTATVVRVRALTVGTINGVSTVSATVVRTRTLTPAVNGVTTVSATVVRTRALTAAVNGVSTVTATVVRTRTFAPSINSIATVSVAALVRTRALVATSNGTSTVTATVTTNATTAAATQDNAAGWISYYYG